MKLNIDFETRSLIDLRETGVYPYAQHESTAIWCMAFAFGDEDVDLMAFADAEDRPEYWETHPQLQRIYDHVASGGEVWAWNAQFERIVWNWVLTERMGWPALRRDQTWDTAAEAAALALPRALGQAAAVLNVEAQKDDDGRRLMLQMAKPRKKKPLTWWNVEEKMERLYDYCRQDVRTERAVEKMTRPLSDFERRVYLLDQKANDRGVMIDVPLVIAAKEMAGTALDEADEELRTLTDGEVSGVTKVADMIRWVRAQGVEIDNLRKDTVRDLLDNPEIEGPVRQVLQLRQDAGKTSVAKLDAMLRAICHDDRARGLLLYHGASTGRWAGKLVQPQNFPRPELDAEAYIQRVMELAYEMMDEPIMKVISSMLRSMLRAAPGRCFMAGDYSQIEARVLAWIAGQEDLVELFRSGGKIYETMAAFIFKLAVEEIAKDSFERQIGKNSVLGAGFQMGADRFAEQVWEQTGIVLDRGSRVARCTHCEYVHSDIPIGGKKTDWGFAPCCPKMTLETLKVNRPDLAAQAIDGYRTLYHKIPQFWKDIERAAIRAVQDPGSVHTCGVGGTIRYTMRNDILWCILPSGRTLAYFKPRLAMRRLPEPYQDIEKLSLSFVGVDGYTRKWRRQHTYGGHLTENVVQAMARDLMAGAMLRLEDAGYPVILTVHDEVLTEPKLGHGSVEQFEEIMTTLPGWAEGLPVAAEGWKGERYRK